ncbi:MAG: hypothetical protein WC310_05755 [Patescibacteria group bacterium]|nr:hypothetical protein [Candidatus Paceibacterota bacterium]
MKKTIKRIIGQFGIWFLGLWAIDKMLGLEYGMLYMGATLHLLATAILVCVIISWYEKQKKRT